MNLYSQIAKNKRQTVIYVAIFLVFAGAIGWFISYYYNDGGTSAFLALAISLPMALFSYFGSERVALAANGAIPIDPKRSPAEKDLYRMVENLCISIGLPMPKIHIVEDPAMNAFACGRDPEHASIAFTTGLIQKLERAELEGVAAHELSHIKNYDVRLSTVVVILVGLIALLSDWFLRFGFFGGRRRRSSDSEGGSGNGILMIVGIVLIVLSPIIARLISLAVSRRREFLADASGALITRYPDGLARALQKIDADSAEYKHANDATMHLYFESPYAGNKHGNWLHRLFATHPPAEERIAALMNLDLKKFEREYQLKK